MIDRGGHVRVVPTTTTEEWVEEIDESEIPLTDYQRRLLDLREAEADLHQETTTDEDDAPALR